MLPGWRFFRPVASSLVNKGIIARKPRDTAPPYIAAWPRKIGTYGRRFLRFSRAKRPNLMAGRAQKLFSKFPDFNIRDM